MAKTTAALLVIGILLFSSCQQKNAVHEEANPPLQDTVTVKDEADVKKEDTVTVEKELLYDQYTLGDSYPYKDTTRRFQWEKIKAGLKTIDSMQIVHSSWGILQNYRNNNDEAPLVKEYHRNVYKRISDNYDVERYQSVPLYSVQDTLVAERYGRDGSLVKLIKETDSTRFRKIETIYFKGEWLVPRKYVKEIADSVVFNNAIFVDRINENVVTLQKTGDKWMIRSMNPVTTGLHKPPHQQETPLGMFVIQEKKYKMFFLVDGTTETGGFAPYASRFTNGGYLHGIPVNAPRKEFIEYSPSLGTTPRSHMCVRNATSHAKFIYDTFPVAATVVFVIE